LRIGCGGDLGDVVPDPVGVDIAVIVQKRLQIESGEKRVELFIAEPTGGSGPKLSGSKPRAIGGGGLRLRLRNSVSDRSLLLAHPLLPKLFQLGMELLELAFCLTLRLTLGFEGSFPGVTQTSGAVRLG